MRKCGFYVSMRRIIDTGIYGSSIEELYSTLSFFAKSNMPEYEARSSKFLPVLREYSDEEDDYFVVGIKELVFEIVKL